MQKGKRVVLGLLGVGLFVLGEFSSLQATMVRKMDFGEIVARSERIFVGRVTEVKEGQDKQGMGVTSITFSVSQPIKGNVPPKLTIKQIGRRTPPTDARNNGKPVPFLTIPDMPTYTVGEEVVLFLNGTSSIGLTSPVGLDQGVYRITQKEAKPVVSNGFLSKTRVEPTRLDTDKIVKKAKVNLKEFLSMTEKLVRAPR